MGPKTFKKIIDHLFPIRNNFNYKISKENTWCFDYPCYGMLPKSISNTLSSEAVDAMQHIIEDKFETKIQFAIAYRNRLRELGEPGKY